MSDNSVYPNWGSLRRLPLGRNKPSSSEDFWEKQPLKSDLIDGGCVRFKWIRHHISPRKTLFTPRDGDIDGPDLAYLLPSRTTHVDPSPEPKISYDDDWMDPMMAHHVLDKFWKGKSIFIEEKPIQSVMSLDVEDYMEVDYVNNKEAWEALDALEAKNSLEVSAVTTESDYLASRISQTESSSDGGTELDSHADSPVVGRNCFVLRRTGKKVRVSGFSDKLGKPLEVDIVDGVVAYDDPTEGSTYLF